MITDDVKQVISSEEQNRSKQRDFNDLKETYKNLRKEGILKKQTYSLPPLDTIGKRLSELMPNKYKIR